MLRPILNVIWKHRHRAFRAVRRVQCFMGDMLERIPLPVSLRTLIGDMLFIACDALIVKTKTYQRWKSSRIGRGRIHALLGKSEDDTPFPLLPPITAPSDAQWAKVAYTPEGATVDVIIPVYSGYAETLRCIYAVLTSNNQTRYELIVINDGSQDAALIAMLYELVGRNLFTLIENDRNLGFVATVNRGMQLHPDRDVVLLNADTEVYGNWLDRLRAHLPAAGKVGSITPLSNNAEIASYPYFIRDNQYALELELNTLDTLTAQAASRLSCPTPTGVGFCIYIPRACLNEVGYFDEKTFGRGYGEENDFCLRATALGYTHLLAGDVFVRHAGGTSFGEEKQARAKAAWKILKKRYPHYAQQVAEFVATDPALPLRRALDTARLKARSRERNVLMISHALGGGTHKHLLEQMHRLEHTEDTGSFLLSPTPDGQGYIALSHPDIPHTPNLVFTLDAEHDALLATLKQLHITRLHVHHLIQFPEGMMECVRMLADRLGVAYEVTVHDYYMFCPRINLTTEEDTYCGEPDIQGCAACLATRSSHAGNTPIWLWRERFAQFLRAAHRVITPDMDVMQRMQKHFPHVSFSVEPHEKEFSGYPSLARAHAQGQRLRVGLLGALSPLKGARIIEALVQDAQVRNLPIEYVLIGYSDYAPLQKPHERFHFTGRYADADLAEILREQMPHLLLFPSIWPETYCYTLSHAFRYQIWPVAFDFGAQASRISARGFGSTLPREMMAQPAAINDFLLALEIQNTSEVSSKIA